VHSAHPGAVTLHRPEGDTADGLEIMGKPGADEKKNDFHVRAMICERSFSRSELKREKTIPTFQSLTAIDD
jgi:hypothetical protein